MKKAIKMLKACGAVTLAAGITAAGLAGCSDKKHIVGKVETTIEATTDAPIPVFDDYVPSCKGMTERAKLLMKQNKDVCGWIRINNTDVDGPIVKDPGVISEGQPFYGEEAFDANYFYLDHDFHGGNYRGGTLFMDYTDNFGAVEDSQSENIVIYGHNMADNTMFGSLRRYRQDLEYFERAPFVELSSNYKDYDYVICCCAITSGSASSDYLYWTMEELDDEATFNEYISKARERQLFDTGVDVKYGDKLLTMSTCYADEDNSRFIVIARRLRDGESADDLSTVKRTDEYIKAHTPTEPASGEDPAENAEEDPEAGEQ